MLELRREPGMNSGACARKKKSGMQAGMRLLAMVAAAAVLSPVDSEALPGAGSPRALPRAGVPVVSRGLGFPTVRRRWRGGRPDGFAAATEALSSLRGGGFSWGSDDDAPARSTRGASGLFGSSWGTGNTNSPNSNDGEANNARKRVDTRGPPDLNARPPPTAPGSSSSSSRRVSNSSGGRERVKTRGPPDARADAFGGAERRRPGGDGGGGRWGGAGSGYSGTAVGGRSDSYWPNGRSSGRDNGQGGGGGFLGGRGSDDGGGATRGLMAVHYLVLSCFGLFSANVLFGVDRLFGLSLDHGRPRWWQPMTSLLLHGDQHHLMGNMFNLIIFGKMAEEDMGSFGMLTSFIACGVASSVVSLAVMPGSISSCGASGAIFGLYSICVLGKLFNVGRRSSEGRPRKLIEAAVFGWFVVESVMSELRMVAAGGVRGTDHAAHFGGVFAGAVLILLARRSIREGKGEM